MIKIATSPQIEQIQAKALELDYNRVVSMETIKNLDPDGFHVVDVLMMHEHAAGELTAPHYRCQVLLKMNKSEAPATVHMDIPIDLFEALADVPVPPAVDAPA